MKVEHQKPGGLFQDISISTWKWEDFNMDIIVRLPRTRQQYDSSWVIVDRITKSAHFIFVKVSYKVEDYAKLYLREMVRSRRYPIGWFEVGEVALIRPELVHEAIKTVRPIRVKSRTSQSRQKSYADVRRRDLEFDVLDWVYLKISPMKGDSWMTQNSLTTNDSWPEQTIGPSTVRQSVSRGSGLES
ncbi:hypothetical protein MTR67_027088 [Solanum verrucosum]|uniref:Reverse transcriptase domain-containing protein n=1 Tax=Solanum verrucosum TaxID=315347 RepID=A0AAF0R303_SOLVR|nr:hypothetical protein MTR67_027088 [Solanum verrucosum]